MILSASRRTDIPCYYGAWLLNRLRAGYALMRNPMNHAQLSRVPLTPDIVDCIVFWTKDAQNFLQYLPVIDKMGYQYYFQFTLTPYGRDIEPNLRPKEDIIKTFIELSKKIDKTRVLWRYDPIIVNDTLTVDYHITQFTRLCGLLSPYTTRVTISFVDTYQKLRTPAVRALTQEEITVLGKQFGKIAAAHGLTIGTCCEAADLSAYGIGRAHCIDQALIEQLCGCSLDVRADKNQRGGCGCVQSVDIGAYNTCPNGCVYCYANNSAESAAVNHQKHNPAGALLIGTVREDEKISVRKAVSHRQTQRSIFNKGHSPVIQRFQ